MAEYDIRNGYELHNLLRKINSKYDIICKNIEEETEICKKEILQTKKKLKDISSVPDRTATHR